MKYVLLITIILSLTSCAFKKLKPGPGSSEKTAKVQTQSGLDELEELEKEKKPVSKRKKARMSLIDTDSDGQISYREYMISKKNTFKRLDANGDGFLTIEELKARRFKAKSDRLKR